MPPYSLMLYNGYTYTDRTRARTSNAHLQLRC